MADISSDRPTPTSPPPPKARNRRVPGVAEDRGHSTAGVRLQGSSLHAQADTRGGWGIHNGGAASAAGPGAVLRGIRWAGLGAPLWPINVQEMCGLCHCVTVDASGQRELCRGSSNPATQRGWGRFVPSLRGDGGEWLTRCAHMSHLGGGGRSTQGSFLARPRESGGPQEATAGKAPTRRDRRDRGRDG